MNELSRFLRHAVAPFTTWLVAKGYLPEAMQSDVTEAIVLGLGFAVPFALSYIRDHRHAVSA